MSVNNRENPLSKLRPRTALRSKIIKETTEESMIATYEVKPGCDLRTYSDPKEMYKDWFMPDYEIENLRMSLSDVPKSH